MTHTERAIHNLANAFCELKHHDYSLYKASLESLANLARSEVLAQIERDFRQASEALKD